MVGNAVEPCGERRLTGVVALNAAQGFDKHILIDFFGILTACHDALHHAKHRRTIFRKQLLTGGRLMLSQVVHQDG